MAKGYEYPMKQLCRVAGLVLSLLVLAVSAPAEEPETHQLGPTGLAGTLAKNAIQVTKVDQGSPAEGKVKVGDEIIGAGTSKFKTDIRRELADAVDAAETENAGGKLTLILKGGLNVDLQLTVLGSYRATAPYDCPKSSKIIERAAEAILKAGKIDQGVCRTDLLGLMATGEKKYIDAVADAIHKADWVKPDVEKIEAVLRGDEDMGYVGWYWGYNLIALGEYYLLTKDESVLPAITTYAVSLARGQDAGGLWGHRMATPKRNGRLPGYAQMNQPCLSSFLGLLMAEKCGIKDPALDKGIEKTYAYFASFVGRGSFNYGVHGPNTANYNNNGTSGSAALCMSIKGNKEGAQFFSRMTATSYDGMEKGHASTFFNPLWTPLGASLSGPEVTRMFFGNSLWLQTMYRKWDGGFSRNGGGQRAGSQTGVALLTYCLPRKVLLITGRNSDESIWVKGKEAAEVVGMSKIDFKSKSADELINLFGNPFPQVARQAVWALRDKEGDFTPRLLKMMKEGTKKEKQSAIEYFGWQCPTNTALAAMETIGSVLRDTKENPEVRADAAGSLSILGTNAYKYYGDIVKFAAEERPEDKFGDIDWSVGKSLNTLCADPFNAGLVTDKDVFYKVALKLGANKRQHVRADGMRMLAGMPLEDFYRVGDAVMHIIKDEDPTYHSYHSPGGPVGSAIEVFANLKIKEGIPLSLGILDMEGGKGSFKIRAVMDSLANYGGNAREMLEQIKADKRFEGVDKNPKLSRSWNGMIMAIEQDKNPAQKMMTFEEAKQYGVKKSKQ
jgi:hypothetical protein